MKTIRIAILSTAFFCAACSSSKPEPGPDPNIPICPGNPDWLEIVMEQYWVNEELYTCKRVDGQTVRLTDDLWHSVVGWSQSIFYFQGDGTVRVYGSIDDPIFWDKYGNVPVYTDHAFSYDETTCVLTLDGYDGVPRGPMTVTQVSESEFWVECPVIFSVPEGEFDLAVFRIRDKAVAEAFFKDAIPLSQVELPCPTL